MRQNLTERVSLAIRVEMLKQKVTTQDLADRLGESYQWVYRRLMSCKTPLLLEDVQRLFDALDMPLSALLSEDERGQPAASVAS